jgi:cyclase
MIKKRLCFTLLYSEGSFCVSRNFKLQKVGDIDWLLDNYNFETILEYLDELIILNIDKKNNNEQYSTSFFEDTEKILKKCFLPVAIGGGINNFEIVKKLFNSGADKIILNSAFYSNRNLIKKIADNYGNQSIVCSIDYKGSEFKNVEILIKNGSKKIEFNIKEYIEIIQEFGVGELLLNSIDRDGLGYGYDYETLKEVRSICDLPIIAAGGADNYIELVKGIESNYLNAVSTSHLFNFIGKGILQTREEMIKMNANIPVRNIYK